jgi:hypothetical protein
LCGNVAFENNTHHINIWSWRQRQSLKRRDWLHIDTADP